MQIIKIDGEIGRWGISSSFVKNELENMSGDVVIEINSPGGSVFEGISIFNAIRAYDSGKVEILITGLAASMASYIALAGDSVKAYDNAVYMIHNASVISWGDARQLRKDANHVESLTKLLSKEYVTKTGKSEKEIQQLLDDETYFYGDEILDSGFIDEIIVSNEEDDPMTAKAMALESVQACVKNYRANITDSESDEVAAIVKKTLRVNSASAQIKNNPIGESMKTYSEKDFQALNDTHAEALKTANDDAVASERKRVNGIIALGGNEAFTTKAISDGSSVGDAAIALVKTQGAEMKKLKNDFEAGASEVDGLATDEDTEVLSSEAKAEKEADEALANFGGK